MLAYGIISLGTGLSGVVEDMANASKNKGDRAERAYLAHALAEYPQLVRDDAMRHLGAGRRDDVGDVRVFDGVSIQVKHWSNVSSALIDAAVNARRQRLNARAPYGVGIVKVPHARPPKPVWLATSIVDEWPLPVPASVPIFLRSSKLLDWLRTDQDPPRIAAQRQAATTKTQMAKLPPLPAPDPRHRVALWTVRGTTLAVGTETAWVNAWSSTSEAAA